MPRPSDAKSRFIATAADLFRRKGYNGVGLNEIIAASGAPKGSFYHHFPGGKEELGVEAVRLAGHRIAKMIDQALSEATDFDAAAVRLADEIGAWFEASGWRDGCPVTAIVVDAVPGSEPLSAAVAGVIALWIDRAAAHGERLGVPDARERAQRFVIALEGAWLVSRIQRSREPFRLAALMAR
jgi:TetR/AcrR family transcriptional repressor of lmrAB and yxaGH operons